MSEKIFAISNTLLSTILIYFVISGFYQIAIPNITNDFSILKKKEIALSLSSKTSYNPLSFYEPIIERDLFKYSQARQTITDSFDEPVVDIDVELLKQTDLKLKLWGTVTGYERAYAVIEDTSKREQNLYRKGDNIQDATLKLILRDQVVLNINGEDQVMKMEEKDLQNRRYNSGSSDLQNSDTITVNRAKIDNALQDINKLMSSVRIQPFVEKGKPAGLLLSRVKSASIFKDMGLRSGDIIKSVNGQEIESVDDGLQFYENLRSASNISLEIKRHGRIQTINYTIR